MRLKEKIFISFIKLIGQGNKILKVIQLLNGFRCLQKA